MSDVQWLRASEVAERLGLHVNTVKRMPDLPYYRIVPRGDRRYRLDELEAWLAARKVSA